MKYQNLVSKIQQSTTPEEVDLLLQAGMRIAIKQFCAEKNYYQWLRQKNLLAWNHDVDSETYEREIRNIQKAENE